MSNRVLIPGSTWGDVFVSNGCIGCAYDLSNSVVVEFYSLDPVTNKVVEKAPYRSFNFDENILFVRATENRYGALALCGQGHSTGKFRYSGLLNVPDVLTYGTQPCDVVATDDGSFIWSVQISGEGYLLNSNEQKILPHEIWGTSQGMIQLLNGQPVWSDLVRASIPEMFFPFLETSIYVGEGRTDPAHVQALEAGKQKNILNQVADRPRAAYDSANNVFAIASRSNEGVSFNFSRLPLPDLNPIPPDPIPPEPEPEPMPWTCVLPPQDVVRDYIYTPLRKFCQDYTVPPTGNNPAYPPGSKPYVNDEIHVNGLFMSDGLGYFQWGDTSAFVKTLVNPEDTRAWPDKAKAATDSLFKYMKQRVGDFT